MIIGGVNVEEAEVTISGRTDGGLGVVAIPIEEVPELIEELSKIAGRAPTMIVDDPHSAEASADDRDRVLHWFNNGLRPEPPEGYEFCTWEEADRGVYDGERRGLFRASSGEWKDGEHRNDPDDEGHILWMRKTPKPQPRRWASPDGSVVYEEVERFEDADYAGTVAGGVARTVVLDADAEWYVESSKESAGKGLGLTWVRCVSARIAT